MQITYLNLNEGNPAGDGGVPFVSCFFPFGIWVCPIMKGVKDFGIRVDFPVDGSVSLDL